MARFEFQAGNSSTGVEIYIGQVFIKAKKFIVTLFIRHTQEAAYIPGPINTNIKGASDCTKLRCRTKIR